MTALTDQRETLAADLAATGLQVYAAWPGRVVAPCVIVVPAAPWIDAQDITFGEKRARVSVHIIAAPGTADDALDWLESAVESVLFHTAADWSLESVDAPSLVNISGAEHLGTTIVMAKPFRPTAAP